MFDLITAAHALGQPPGGEGSPSPIAGMMPLILIVVIAYLLILRPQMKKQKAQQRMIDELEKGDDIVTSGGVHGSIANIKDDTLVLKVAENVKIEVSRTAVSRNKSSEKRDS